MPERRTSTGVVSRKPVPSVAPSDAGTEATSASMVELRISTLDPTQPNAKTQNVSYSPVQIRSPSREYMQPSQARIESGSVRSTSSAPSAPAANPSSLRLLPPSSQEGSLADAQEFGSFRFELDPPNPSYAGTSHSRTNSEPSVGFHSKSRLDPDYAQSNRSTPSIEVQEMRGNDHVQQAPGLPYFHRRSQHRQSQGTIGTFTSSSSDSQSVSAHEDAQGPSRSGIARPVSSYTLGSELHRRGRSQTPNGLRQSQVLSPFARDASISSARSSSLSKSGVDELNIPYAQQVMQHQTLSEGNAKLRAAVGANASLLDTKKTIDLYRLNAKKTNDMSVQYEFAIFMVNAAREAALQNPTPARSASSNPGKLHKHDPKAAGDLSTPAAQQELLDEARSILSRLADRGYQYAQYYLADGYASGIFNHGKGDDHKAFPLFVAAGKHGHAESGYRAALCYEHGWGARKDYLKAVQYYRQSASKGHPGAATRLGKACLTGDMGLVGKAAQREGIKWLKRAAEGADERYNQGPYELGKLHVNGYGEDVFKDEAYAAQLFTQAASLGHADAAMRLGEAYEMELLGCPRDPSLAIHFYNQAAEAGVPQAMMALSAWYLFGAEPVLPKDEAEAYQWALRAAEAGNPYPKAEYAVGYYTEMGYGCQRDPLEANRWYVQAAEHGDKRAVGRLKMIREAQTLLTTGEAPKDHASHDLKKRKSFMGLFNKS